MSDNHLRRSDRITETKSKKNDSNNCHLNDSEDIKSLTEIKCQTKKELVCEKCWTKARDQTKKRSNKRKTKLKLKTCFDPLSQKWLNVCNKCAKVLNRNSKISEKTKELFKEQKKKYLSNCHSFGLSLVQLLNNSSAERLYCPNLRTTGKACACLQRYVIGSDDSKYERAHHLMDLLIKAKQLSQQKCYLISNPKSGQKIGLGNGHKKSTEFENFVKIQRNHLRNDLNFCEKAVQRVLFYSNNFLHKKLKTEPNGRQRVERQKRKTVADKQIDINSLQNELCCPNSCVQLSQTRPQLIQDWRQRAVIGQQEARRVLAEMLTPTQGVRTNCFKFITLVTGISIRTISKVNEHLIENGGNREPAEHGLKRFYLFNDKKQSVKAINSCNSSNQEITNV